MEVGLRTALHATTSGSPGSPGSPGNEFQQALECCNLRYLRARTPSKSYPVSPWPRLGPDEAPGQPWKALPEAKGTPMDGQRSPRAPQRSQKEPKVSPKAAKGTSKTPKGSPKGSQREPQGAQSRPKGSQRHLYINKLPINRPSGRYVINTWYQVPGTRHRPVALSCGTVRWHRPVALSTESLDPRKI